MWRGWQKMRWLDGITDSCTWVWANSVRQWRKGKPGGAIVHRVRKSQTWPRDWKTACLLNDHPRKKLASQELCYQDRWRIRAFGYWEELSYLIIYCIWWAFHNLSLCDIAPECLGGEFSSGLRRPTTTPGNLATQLWKVRLGYHLTPR